MAKSAAALKVIREVRPPSAAVKREGYADAGEVGDFAAELPDKYLLCREMQHNWRPFDYSWYDDGGFDRVLRCARCTTKKRQTFNSYGMPISGASYDHPEGYLHAGLGRIVGEGRGALRLESAKRSKGKGN